MFVHCLFVALNFHLGGAGGKYKHLYKALLTWGQMQAINEEKKLFCLVVSSQAPLPVTPSYTAMQSLEFEGTLMQ